MLYLCSDFKIFGMNDMYRPSNILLRGRAFSARIMFSICLLFCAGSLWADSADSLIQAFNNHAGVSEANAFLAYLSEEGLTDELLSFPPDASHDSVCASVWYWSAEWYYENQDYSKAELYALRALPLTHAVGDKTMEADCASLLGLIYVRLGKFDRAAIYAKQCNQLDLESGDVNNIASSFNTLAGIYMSMRQTDEAERYILQAIDYVEKTDNLSRKAVIYGMASEVYLHKFNDADRLSNNHDKRLVQQTLTYATRAWEMEKQLGREAHAAVRQTQRAAALTVLERYEESEQCLMQAIPVLEQSGNIHSLGIAYNHLGDLYYITGRNQKGADAYYKALDIFLSQHDIYNEAHTRKGLRETLRGIDPKAALEHGDRFEHLRDSIYDREANAQLSQYAAQYENDLLQQINRKQRTRYIILIGLIILLFACLSAGTYIFSRKQERKQVEHIDHLLNEVSQLRSRERLKHMEEMAQKTSREDSKTPNGKKNLNDTLDKEQEDNLFLARVTELVHQHMPHGMLTIESAASVFGMSVSTFRRRIIAITGESPKTFFQAIQMNEAARKLVEGQDKPLKLIADECGFDEVASFARTFKRVFGVTPSAYREQTKKTTQQS